jgi:uroporphyrin-III C-methyltransferase/precorrin-2 dehydrogenase/sirohydrochlorin ferrochelatase
VTIRYPLALDLAGRRVLVVGGGPVAARRSHDLVTAGAVVIVVAPAICEDLRDILGAIDWRQRDYADGDVAGCWLAVACADDPRVNAAVVTAAEEARIWAVRADDAELSPAHTPAVTRAAGVTVAVSAGGDPRTATALRDAIAVLLATGGLPLRRHRRSAGVTGQVALVGGGPGDPGLITTRGRELLAAADVVVVDRLAPRALLDTVDDDVEVIDAGKAAHAHTLTQDQINEILVERALAGLRVVRLKGGDPYVLGRGAEEAAYCIAAGVPVEVVPGVTSATAVPAAAGIPVTHRGTAAAFTVASGHGDLDVEALARAPGTLVVLMGLSRLRALADGLVAAGRRATTPTAVIADGTTAGQRHVVADLATIADAVAAARITAPAVVVVGDVVAMAGIIGGLS